MANLKKNERLHLLSGERYCCCYLLVSPFVTTFWEMMKVDIAAAAADTAVVDTVAAAAVALGTPWVVVDTDTVHQDHQRFVVVVVVVVVEGMDTKMEAVAAFLMFLVLRLLLVTMVEWPNE